MAAYTKLSINTTEEQGDIIAAYLSEFPFDSFDYQEGLLGAYIPTNELDSCRVEVERILEEEGFVDYFFENIEAQNWNLSYSADPAVYGSCW